MISTKFALIFCLIQHTVGWGQSGHRIITGLALRRMPDIARQFLQNVIGDDDEVIEASIWADSEDARTRFPGSSSYHFCFTKEPQCGEFRIDRDCGNWNERTCIVTALENIILTIVDVETSAEERRDAVQFLLHLMGDVHHPLHVGFRTDNGGTRIKLDSPPQMSLHEIWDNWMIDQFMRSVRGGTWRHVVQALETEEEDRFLVDSSESFPLSLFAGPDSAESISEYTASLASHTATRVTCAHGYTDERGRKILGRGVRLNERSYLASKIPVVKLQLTRASSHLRFVLSQIATEYFTRRREQRVDRQEARYAALFAPLVEQASKAAADLNGRSDTCEAVWDIGFSPRSTFDDSSEEDEEEAAGGIVVSRDTASPTTTVRPSEVAAVVKVKKTSVRAAKAAEDLADDAAFELAMAESAELAKRAAQYTFNGIDLSQIGFWTKTAANSGGKPFHIVTTKDILKKSPRYEPRSYFKYCTYLTSPDNGTYTLEEFHFDTKVFMGSGRRFTDEVKIRSILKLSGKDCTIDVSDFLAAAAAAASTRSSVAGNGASPIQPFAPLVLPAETLMEFDMIPEIEAERAQSIARWAEARIPVFPGVKRQFRFLSQVLSKRSETLVVTAGVSVRAFVLPETLRTSGDWMRFNVVWEIYPLKNGITVQVAYFVDVNIYEGCTDRQEWQTVTDHLMKNSNAVVKNAENVSPRFIFASALDLRPSFHEELKAVNYLMFTEDDAVTISNSTRRSAIEKYARVGKNEPSQLFARVNWKRRRNETDTFSRH